MNTYKLWIKNALEQANQDESWHLSTRRKAKNSIVSWIITLAGGMSLIGFVLLNK